MKKIREIIRLAEAVGMRRRQIAKALDVTRPSFDKYLGDFRSSGLSYSQVEARSDSEFLAIFERKDQEKDGRYQTPVAKAYRFKRTRQIARSPWISFPVIFDSCPIRWDSDQRN
ncbi:helix-turn-helix domain-containing protein [bacterium]|nr:helix-turn-helix domain-containing protein [candidate division CSSED10-310 bacterium]